VPHPALIKTAAITINNVIYLIDILPLVFPDKL
jgi:hypothetical protein